MKLWHSLLRKGESFKFLCCIWQDYVLKKPLKGLVRIIYSLHCTLLHQLDRFMIPLQGSVANVKVI